jgi:hypothetical protein
VTRFGPPLRRRLLAEADATLERVQHEFIAEIPSPRTAQLLDIVSGAALQRVNRLAFTAFDQPHRRLVPVITDHRLPSQVTKNTRKVRI